MLDTTMTSIIKLPILQGDEAKKSFLTEDQINEINFPNGKGHVSYSEVIDWVECSYRHHLKHVKKINLDGNSIHTIFGGIIHDSLEHYLINKKLPDINECLETFRTSIDEMDDGPRKEQALKLMPEFEENMEDMIKSVPPWLDEKFPGWHLVGAEHFLYEEIDNSNGVRFKGFLDAIIRVKKKQTKKFIKECTDAGKEVPDLWDYYIIDYKTCSWGWNTEMKRKFEKQMQLMLYKHYFSKETGIPLSSIKCGFVLVKRTSKTNRVEYVPISAGEKSIEKSLKTVSNMINQVKKGFMYKNRKNCKPFCPYNGTEFCQ